MDRGAPIRPFAQRWGIPYHPGCGSIDIHIKNDVWIGSDVTIKAGVTIGNGAIVGMCAVVAKDVPDYAIVVGNPGRVIKYRFDQNTIDLLLRVAWWNWDDDRIRSEIETLTSIDRFIDKYQHT